VPANQICREHDSVATLRDRPAAGLTVHEVARRFRVSPDKVRGWIRRGELAALNTASALSGRPQLRITREALAAFEQRRTVAPPPKPPRRRRRTAEIDYYPDQ
jgi:excisionase family DNA binding protein